MKNVTDEEFEGIWLPAEICHDEELSANEKMVWGAINECSRCIATPEELAHYSNLSCYNFKKNLNALFNKGFVKYKKVNKEYVIKTTIPMSKLNDE